MYYTHNVVSAVKYQNGFNAVMVPIDKAQFHKCRGHKEVFFSIDGANTTYQKELIQGLGLNLDFFYSKGITNSYTPQTINEFMTCLQNTDYRSFSKYVSGHKADEHFQLLIKNFVEVNLDNQISVSEVASLATQVQKVILNDKGPKLYAEKIKRYETQIQEAQARMESFSKTYIGGAITPEDNKFVDEVMNPSTVNELTTEYETANNGESTSEELRPSIEDIVNAVIRNRSAQQPLNPGVPEE